MSTPKHRNGIKLPKILAGSSPLGRESSVLSRNSGGLQSSSIMSISKRNHRLENIPVELGSSPANALGVNGDYMSRISQFSSQMDVEALPIMNQRSSRPPIGRNNPLPKLNHSTVITESSPRSGFQVSPRTSRARLD